MNPPSLSDAMLETLQRDTFAYFLDQRPSRNDRLSNKTV